MVVKERATTAAAVAWVTPKQNPNAFGHLTLLTCVHTVTNHLIFLHPICITRDVRLGFFSISCCVILSTKKKNTKWKKKLNGREPLNWIWWRFDEEKVAKSMPVVNWILEVFLKIPARQSFEINQIAACIMQTNNGYFLYFELSTWTPMLGMYQNIWFDYVMNHPNTRPKMG